MDIPACSAIDGFCVAPLFSGALVMDTSASRSAEKKDKMDGSGFPDVSKKPSETRGNTPVQDGN